MPLSGLRVLDLTDHAGALCSRFLGEFGAEVVRVEPPGGAAVRRIEPLRGGQSLAHLYANRGKRCIALDPESAEGAVGLRRLARAADVIIDGRERTRPPEPGFPDPLEGATDRAVVVRVTPFGSDGPRSHWRGSDLVCAARAGMVYVNGRADEPPLVPFGLAAYAATGIHGAVAALLGLRARDGTGRGSFVDLSVAEAAAGALEHVTGLFRQTGAVPRRTGSLHWSRTFRIGDARDGPVLLSHLGDWTTLSEWVASECPEVADLTDPRWQDVNRRREHAEHVFALLDRWLGGRTVAEACHGAELRRLLFTEVRSPETLARDPQLAARRFVSSAAVGGVSLGLARQPCRLSARAPTSLPLPAVLRDDPDDVLRAWSAPRALPDPGVPPMRARPLDGVVVLDFTWVVAGPVATRILADHGARVVKVEHRNAPDFGTRRDGLTGNLNRGKQSIVIDMESDAGRSLAHRLAARADVVIDNFSARVMDQWGLDYASLRERRGDAIGVRLTGFGLDGPLRDRPSYGPTLQALAGYAHLMRMPGGAPTGWGYSWSDMVAGLTGALATLVALRHRERTGEGQLVDVSQFETLVSVLGPRSLDLLAGRPVAAPGNRSQEGARAPQGIFRCTAEGEDDDRWLALSIEDDAMWARFATVLSEDGEDWAAAKALSGLAARIDRQDEIEAKLTAWTRTRRTEDLEERLQSRGIAAAVVANGADLVGDAQMAHRGYFERVAGEDGEEYVFDGIPFLSSALPGRITAPGPLCGEHTDSVLSELLGLGSEEIRDLRAQEVIG